MSIKKIIKIGSIIFSLIIATSFLIIQYYDYGKLFVIEYPFNISLIFKNAPTFFGIFIFFSFIVFAIRNINLKYHSLFINALNAVYILYNIILVLFFTYASIRLHIRAMEPGSSLAGYIDLVEATILLIMSIVIVITTIKLSRSVLNANLQSPTSIQD